MRLLLPLLLGCAAPGTDTGSARPALTVVSFNTGTTPAMGNDPGVADGYGPEAAAHSDTWYGDGLAWVPAVQAAAAFFAAVEPDLVTFQEVFWSNECAAVPAEARAGFVCARWQEGDPTVAQVVLGPDYQVACHPGKPDKCAAVHTRLGRFAGCDADFCLEGLTGSTIEGCGSGARIGRGEVIDADGAPVLTLVNVHGSSGLGADDQGCRVAQVEQVFVDLGDGSPAARGARTVIAGDLNTDPGRWADIDPSAARWLDFTGPEAGHQFVSAIGQDAPGSYQGIADIDHVLSDTGEGTCWHAGLGEHPAVYEGSYFDHRPVVCTLP